MHTVRGEYRDKHFHSPDTHVCIELRGGRVLVTEGGRLVTDVCNPSIPTTGSYVRWGASFFILYNQSSTYWWLYEREGTDLTAPTDSTDALPGSIWVCTLAGSLYARLVGLEMIVIQRDLLYSTYLVRDANLGWQSTDIFSPASPARNNLAWRGHHGAREVAESE